MGGWGETSTIVGVIPILRSLVPWMAGFCALFALDAALFRTPYYRRILEPDSYAGQMERALSAAGNQTIAVLGDSRIAEGFSPRVADRRQPSLRFLNASVPGSTPRCWYYLLRDLDPKPGRFKIIVLPVEAYEDEDGGWEWADRTLDLNFLAARLRLADTLTVTASFHSAETRWNALLVCLLKGLLLREDLQAFLAHPDLRLRKTALYRASGAEWAYNYEGNAKDLVGTVLRDPPPRPASPQTGLHAAYRREWFGRIISRYSGSGTSIVFLRIPRGPVAPAVSYARAGSSIRGFAGVRVLPENLFNRLEGPEYFFDELHLNARGRQWFSTELADVLAGSR